MRPKSFICVVIWVVRFCFCYVGTTYIVDSYSSSFVVVLLKHRCPNSKLLFLAKLPSRGGFLVATPVFLRVHLNSRTLSCTSPFTCLNIIIDWARSRDVNFSKTWHSYCRALYFETKSYIATAEADPQLNERTLPNISM